MAVEHPANRAKLKTLASGMTTSRELLRTAAGTGELVTVAYYGGSHLGQPRKLMPLSVELDELIAIELGGKFKKHYKLFKIAWVKLSSRERVANTDVDPVPPASDVPKPKTVAEYGADEDSSGASVIGRKFARRKVNAAS